MPRTTKRDYDTLIKDLKRLESDPRRLSFTAACKELGIPESSTRSYLARNGYVKEVNYKTPKNRDKGLRDDGQKKAYFL